MSSLNELELLSSSRTIWTNALYIELNCTFFILLIIHNLYIALFKDHKCNTHSQSTSISLSTQTNNKLTHALLSLHLSVFISHIHTYVYIKHTYIHTHLLTHKHIYIYIYLHKNIYLKYCSLPFPLSLCLFPLRSFADKNDRRLISRLKKLSIYFFVAFSD